MISDETIDLFAVSPYNVVVTPASAERPISHWPLLAPPCVHGDQPWIVGVYGASDGAHEPGFKHPGNKRGPRQATTTEAREIMGMPWAKRRRELTEAIPPAYTELIGHQLRVALRGPGADTAEAAA